MSIPGLFGPFQLTSLTVTAQVHGVGPGAYALGSNSFGVFTPQYVGRSDSDLAQRLQQHASTAAYSHFEYGFFNTADLAYAKECQLYHDYKPAANNVHPARPQGSNITCPRCGL